MFDRHILTGMILAATLAGMLIGLTPYPVVLGVCSTLGLAFALSDRELAAILSAALAGGALVTGLAAWVLS